MFKRRKLFSIESGSPRQSEKASNAKAFFRVGTAYAVRSTIGAGILAAIPALVVGCLGGPGLTLYGGAVAAAAIYGGLSQGLAHLFGWGFDKLVNMEDVLSLSRVYTIDVRDRTDREKSPGISKSPITYNNSQLIPEKQLVLNGDPKKYRITFAVRAGVGIILLNNPSQGLLKCLNAGLVSMLNTDRRSDYLSERINGGYIINVKTSKDGFGLLIKQAARSGAKVNCITSDVLDKNILTAKHFSDDSENNGHTPGYYVIRGTAGVAAGAGLSALASAGYDEKNNDLIKKQLNIKDANGIQEFDAREAAKEKAGNSWNSKDYKTLEQQNTAKITKEKNRIADLARSNPNKLNSYEKSVANNMKMNKKLANFGKIGAGIAGAGIAFGVASSKAKKKKEGE